VWALTYLYIYGLNLERRIFHKILYEVDSSDSHDNYYDHYNAVEQPSLAGSQVVSADSLGAHHCEANC
jgi:hypothetical protein